MKAGDRIKLTEKAVLGRLKRAKTLCSSRAQPPRWKPSVDWAARRGTIKSINHGTALVQWDDIKTHDVWLVAALVRA